MDGFIGSRFDFLQIAVSGANLPGRAWKIQFAKREELTRMAQPRQ
jgi:hypothetical protein